jgi:hypothetical protein
VSSCANFGNSANSANSVGSVSFANSVGSVSFANSVGFVRCERADPGRRGGPFASSVGRQPSFDTSRTAPLSALVAIAA